MFDEERVSGGRGGQVAAFLAGLALGAGVALLLAPQSGAETRADIRRGTKRLKRRATMLAGDVRERAEDAMDSARTEFRRHARDVRRGAVEIVDDVRDRVESAKDAGMAGARAARDDLQRRLAEARDGSGAT